MDKKTGKTCPIGGGFQYGPKYCNGEECMFMVGGECAVLRFLMNFSTGKVDWHAGSEKVAPDPEVAIFWGCDYTKCSSSKFAGKPPCQEEHTCCYESGFKVRGPERCKNER